MRRWTGRLLAASAVVVLLVGAAWTLSAPTTNPSAGSDPGPTDAASEAESAKPFGLRKPGVADTKPTVNETATSSDAVPPPIDLDAVDRLCDLHGVVVRADGAPIAGASIVAVSYPWRRLNFLNFGAYDTAVDGLRTRSAADGTFALRLRQGTRTALRVTADGFPDARTDDRLAGEYVRVVLDAGVRLRLTVVDAENHLLPNVRLRLSARGWSGAAVARETASGEDGQAVVEGLPASTALRVEALANGPGDPGWLEFTTGESGETAERVVLPKGRTLSGLVVDDATSAPIAKARVGMSWTFNHAVATDSDGRFDLPGWTGIGIEDVHVVAEGYVRASVVVGDKWALDFRLRRGFEATGRVVDPEGRPVKDALVEFAASVFAEGRHQTSVGDATTGADGRFRVTGLDPKLPHVVIVAADGWGRVRKAGSTTVATPTLDLGDVALAPARRLAGRVLDAACQPVAGAAVMLHGPAEPEGTVFDANTYGSEENVVSDDLGRFAFADLPAGKYDVQTCDDGVPAVHVSATLPPDRDVDDVVIREADSTGVEVRVVDERGEPIAGQCLHAETGGVPVDGWTDAHGIGRLQLTTETAEVRAFLMGPRRFRNCETQTWKKGVASLTFVAREGAALEGTVVDPAGKGVADAILRLVFADGTEDWTGTDASGRFTQVVSPNAKVRLTFDGVIDGEESGLAASAECDAPATAVVVKCERIAVDRTLTVKVTTPDGAPAAGATVTAGLEGWRRRRWTTADARGVARFDELPARPLHVESAAEAWARSADALVLPAGQEVAVALRPGVAIRGVVIGVDGSPTKAGVWAHVGRAYEDVAWACTDGDGRFLLRVPVDVAGPFRITANGAAGMGAAADVVAGATDVRIVLAKR
jgi:hypothetical protein